MRTSRISTATLAVGTAALALSLTACGGSGSAVGGAASTRTGTTTTVGGSAGAGNARQVSGTDDGKNVLASVSRSGSAGGGTVTSGGAVLCAGDEMAYSVLHRFPDQPGEHLLITARNAGSEPCWVTSSPSVVLGDGSDVLPHSTKDAPGGSARITVRPGGKVYSAVALFADGPGPRTAAGLSIALRDGTGHTGRAVEQDARDGEGVPSSFTWSSADVTNWNTARPYDF
ncbi:DUF4232 domain-containing protein [Streptomyces sp. NPDC002466]|uniref:DUF4232 domain-containing protein n=1 Tax=unclassified Streptomyces TaxID=2593676 RepID=UPI0011E7A48D|nr:DUF4232 domain-containing protein [Streptomyces sp. sk2.1]TXS77756.1 DUF4232 domain-containing protein [Streptomyces sp. sk2.1]